MELVITRLSVNNLNEYLNFFEHIAHTDHPEWNQCYCLNYCAMGNANVDFRSPSVRRQYAILYGSTGILQGYMAFADNQMVGWCNANRKSLCTECAGFVRMFPDGATTQEEDVLSIFCFTVAPEYRKQGIAESMLQRVLTEARQDGYALVEAYPPKAPNDEYDAFPGPLHLYEKLGFTVVGEGSDFYIVQKEL